jgi:hypothetical protein
LTPGFGICFPYQTLIGHQKVVGTTDGWISPVYGLDDRPNPENGGDETDYIDLHPQTAAATQRMSPAAS